MSLSIDDLLAQAQHGLTNVKHDALRLKYRDAQVKAMMQRCEKDDMTLLREIIAETADAIYNGKYKGTDLVIAFDMLETAYCLAGFWDFDLYFYGLEFRRSIDSRYYEHRRSVLKPVADAVTDLIVNDKYDILVLNMPPRTGKSTLGIMACTWQGGRQPTKQNLLTGYAAALTDSFYKEINVITQSEEYNYLKIFNQIKRIGQSAEHTSIDYDYKSSRREKDILTRYPTFACRAIGGSLNGQVEAAGLLYADDLTRGYEEALSLDRMDKLYALYTSDLIGRAKEGFKEFHIGTRWSIHDPLGRIVETHKDNPRFKMISIPALDPTTDESNFYYNGYKDGFSTAFYHDRRKTLVADKENNGTVTWECLYQQNPIERGSLVFPENELKRIDTLDFLDKVKRSETIAFVDVAFGGRDYLSMPIGVDINGMIYIVDWLYIRADYKITQPLVCSMLRRWNVNRVVFEANNGGEFYARDIKDMLKKDRKNRVWITSKLHTGNQRKMDRIEAYAPDIKEFVFLSEMCYNDTMYREAMKNLTTFSRTGNNPNDDAPDSLAGLAAMCRTNTVSEVKILSRKHI